VVHPGAIAKGVNQDEQLSAFTSVPQPYYRYGSHSVSLRKCSAAWTRLLVLVKHFEHARLSIASYMATRGSGDLRTDTRTCCQVALPLPARGQQTVVHMLDILFCRLTGRSFSWHRTSVRAYRIQTLRAIGPSNNQSAIEHVSSSHRVRTFGVGLADFQTTLRSRLTCSSKRLEAIQWQRGTMEPIPTPI
jgi:hypothetical protein